MRPGPVVIVLVLLIVAAGFYYLAQNPAPIGNGAMASTTLQYSSTPYGIRFKYPETYQLEEHDLEGSSERVRHVITLVPKADLPPPENGEGPPAITIGIYQNNLDEQSAEEWIRGSNDSNFKLSQERVLASTTINGKPALSYRWSGLYEGTTVVVGEPQWIYAFSVTYMRPGDPIVQDFVALKESAMLE